MLGSGVRGSGRRVLVGRCCAAAASGSASTSRAAGKRGPGAAAALAGHQHQQWERQQWYGHSSQTHRHLGPVVQVASRPLPLLPARGLSSSSSSPNPSPKKEEEGKEDGAAHAADHHAHARETVWTVPNLITMSRIAASPLLSWAILEGHYDYAVAGVCVAAATDWLDGYIAKTYNQASVLGGFLDPLADKVLVAALSIPLAIQGHIPMPLLFVVFGRDALLIAGSFIKRAVNRPEGSHFFDTTTSATFKITPNLLSKINTVLQFSVLTLALSRALWDVPSADIFEPLCWLTGATTVGSGLTYLVGDGTKVLKRRKAAKATTKAASQEPPKAPPPSA